MMSYIFFFSWTFWNWNVCLVHFLCELATLIDGELVTLTFGEMVIEIASVNEIFLI